MGRGFESLLDHQGKISLADFGKAFCLSFLVVFLVVLAQKKNGTMECKVLPWSFCVFLYRAWASSMTRDAAPSSGAVTVACTPYGRKPFTLLWPTGRPLMTGFPDRTP